MTERRNFARILLTWPVKLTASEQNWGTQLIDLCLQGALVQLPPDYPTTSPKPLKLHLHIPQSKVDIDMDVSEAHRDRGTLGLSCTRIDLESIAHLRRLVELNVGSDDLLHRELEQLIDHNAHE